MNCFVWYIYICYTHTHNDLSRRRKGVTIAYTREWETMLMNNSTWTGNPYRTIAANSVGVLFAAQLALEHPDHCFWTIPGICTLITDGYAYMSIRERHTIRRYERTPGLSRSDLSSNIWVRSFSIKVESLHNSPRLCSTWFNGWSQSYRVDGSRDKQSPNYLLCPFLPFFFALFVPRTHRQSVLRPLSDSRIFLYTEVVPWEQKKEKQRKKGSTQA